MSLEIIDLTNASQLDPGWKHKIATTIIKTALTGDLVSISDGLGGVTSLHVGIENAYLNLLDSLKSKGVDDRKMYLALERLNNLNVNWELQSYNREDLEGILGNRDGRPQWQVLLEDFVLPGYLGSINVRRGARTPQSGREDPKPYKIRGTSVSILGKPYQKEIDFVSSTIAVKAESVVIRVREAEGADLIIDGVRWELKTLEAATINAVRQNLRKAVSQSDNIYIDGRGVGLSLADAKAGVQAQVGAGRMKNAQEVVIYTKEGVYKWKP
ncbi:CdiA C-terminal domain-containing protein [Deinococcus sp. UR1]|uniref:CdiA C-terminal domain-containing protein n=1 Tax=Deinococcus sp. UR1 TaxID=1704277 RepID=UPI000A8123E7|nr:hypothetical protein [Deinococcus sp. UR1]